MTHRHTENNSVQKITTVCLLAGTLATGGCVTTPTNAQIGATTGGVLGAALTGNTAVTVVGAGTGAAVGHEIGKRIK